MQQTSGNAKRRTRAALLAALAALAGACASDDDQGGAPAATFDTFVLEQFASNTADDVDPVPINDLDFTFNDEPGAFDALLTD